MKNNYLIKNNKYLNVTNSEVLLDLLKGIDPLVEIESFKYPAFAKHNYLNPFVNLRGINKVDFCSLTNYYSSNLFSETVDNIHKDIGNAFSQKQSICFMHYQNLNELNLICFFVYDNLPYFINMQKYYGDNSLHSEKYFSTKTINKHIQHFVENVEYKLNLLGLKQAKKQLSYVSSIYQDYFKGNKFKSVKLNNINSVSYLSHLSYYINNMELGSSGNMEYYNITDYTNQIETEMEYNRIKVDCFSTSHSVKFEPTLNFDNYNLENPVYISNIKNLNKRTLKTDHAVFFTDASLKRSHTGGGIVILTKENPPIYTSLIYKEKHLKNAKTPDELECLTILYALKYAISNDIKDVKIYTDSQNFLSSFYQTNKKLYKELSKFINKIYYCAFKINIQFIKVKAHTVDIHYNNLADTLAKRNY